jgi:hypothetical protein
MHEEEVVHNARRHEKHGVGQKNKKHKGRFSRAGILVRACGCGPYSTCYFFFLVQILFSLGYLAPLFRNFLLPFSPIISNLFAKAINRTHLECDFFNTPGNLL